MKRYIVLALIFMVTACSAAEETPVVEVGKSDQAQDVEQEAADIYQAAMTLFEDKKYERAAEKFLEIERLYPYAKNAKNAQLMTAISYYRNEQYDEATGSLDRFISLHPGSEDVPYAYFIKAMSYYERISDVGRDQKVTEMARVALKDLIARFPDSTYAKDARLKLDLVNDHLAGKEMEIGRFYLKKHKWVAAINRFKAVVDHYQTTTHTAEALYRLVEAYTSLGVIPEATKYASVLGHNYPHSKWYQRAFGVLERESRRVEE